MMSLPLLPVPMSMSLNWIRGCFVWRMQFEVGMLIPYHEAFICLFLFMVSFAVQKLLSLIRSYVFIFAFLSFALGDWPKKTLIYDLCHRMFCLCSLLGVLWGHVLYLSL